MQRLSYAFFFALFVCTFAIQAKDDPAAAHYIDPTTIDLKALLPGPSAVGSPETQKEINIDLQKQKTRTPVEIERIESENKLTVFVFSDVMGSWFTAQNLPATDTLFKNVAEDTHLVTEQAKKLWSRPRPPLQDKDIKPVVDLEPNGSYPSSHATRGELYALILANMEPDFKEQLMVRGKLIGEDRVIAGVHFPSDVAAGQALGNFLYAKFMASPAFQADLAKAKAEMDAAREKSLAPPQ